jgi:hypothetical protein
MLQTAGFAVERRDEEPFAQTIIATPTTAPFAYHLPSRQASRDIGREISRSGVARPA